MTLALYSYFRSSAAFRVRIALELKGISYTILPVNLLAGEQRSDAYRARNPQGFVPALELPDGSLLTQSTAIIEWLEATQPGRPLLPATEPERARIRAICGVVACDIHPLNNLRVGKALRETFGADQSAIDAWAARWVLPGFEALEALVARHGNGWCFGDAPTLADCYLIPQIYSARRFNVPLEAFPRLLAIDTLASQHPAFIAAHPDVQPDAD